MAYLGIPQNTIAVLQKYHFNFQKKFGQNFLIDTTVLDRIISSAEITKEDCVLEIGPGIGTMTQYLAERAGCVVAVEIDKALLPILEETLQDYDNVTVINDDILKVDINRLVEEKNGGRPIKVVANLPYYITTPIIMGLFESRVPLKSITIMVQKEVADRMQVGPGTKDYGALSLAVQYYAKPEIVANVPPNCFIPRPNVGSADINRLVEEKNGGRPIKVVANLPYYITTPIIMGLFESRVPLKSITIMVQKEVADRMQVGPGTKDYGALSLAVQYYAKPEIVANVPPNCFIPRPNVGSAVIRLTRYEEPPVKVKDEKKMFSLIRASFNQRRKTLVNGLGNAGLPGITKESASAALEQMGLSPTVRGEALTLEQFAQLSDLI